MSRLLFEAKTVQSLVFKTLTESIKDVITDGNFVISADGISLKAMDTSCTVLVSMKLDAAQFEEYHCERKLIIGLSMSGLHRMVRTVTNQDTLTLFIEADNPNVIGIKVDNAERRTVTTYWLNLMDLNEEEINVPPAVFDSVIVMNSADFQKHCRDLHAIGDVLEIRSVGDQLVLATKGDIGKQETVIEASANGMTLENTDGDMIVQGLFSLKYLTLFCKCTALSPQCKICIRNDFPLITVYQIANLGEIRLMLAPHEG